ncbi:hypothetical protein FC093_17165 [Ilyomonas limi]|uniref:Uncharacterized protein n=1 Tax=Ilyomonas limi TaxID=2575867 RepID=A0A4U3KUT6_9BACT|nr:hypothetical protein [Ilyomonas limi]TKK66315.1 hypothetical protein FC093_17165 [Ilyomonas limi]
MKDYIRLAQSASALGAGILGFGIGAKFANTIASYSSMVIVAGGILHFWGMYIMQMKEQSSRSLGIAKWLWISAWICLILLIVIIIYLQLSTMSQR